MMHVHAFDDLYLLFLMKFLIQCIDIFSFIMFVSGVPGKFIFLSILCSSFPQCGVSFLDIFDITLFICLRIMRYAMGKITTKKSSVAIRDARQYVLN